MNLTLDLMKKMWPHGDQHIPGLLEGIAAAAPAVLARYGVTRPIALAHMMGQFSEECGAGLEMVENLNYSADGLARTWPSHFRGGMAARLAHEPRMIADVAYGGRMGNAPPPSDDGWNFRGRGLSQTTGREAYEKLGRLVELDLVRDPDLVCAPEHALACGVCDFVKLCGCLAPANDDDTVEVTKRLNGGLIGLAERKSWTARWKAALGV